VTERILAIPVEALASVFTEWLRRWTESPESFLVESDENYGPDCAAYFTKLALEVGNGRELEIPAP